MLKLYFLKAICHNSDMFRCVLSGGGGFRTNFAIKYKFNISAFVGFIVWIVYYCTDISNTKKEIEIW